MIDFEVQRKAWSAPPVDDVGYIPSTDLLAKSDDELADLVDCMMATRFGGWRNHNNLWVDLLGLASTTGKRVVDFGCGVGIEALTYAQAGNEVWLADISQPNLDLATRILNLYGYPPAGTLLVGDRPPFVHLPDGSVDVFHCSGVLHHIPWPRDIMADAQRVLADGGEARLMLYSDTGWRLATGTEPPDDVTAHTQFGRFVRHFDSVGSYADWYNRDRLQARFGDLFEVERCEYVTPNRQYLIATLRRRSA